MSFSYERAKRELLEEQAELKKQLDHLEVTGHEGIGYSNHMADDATDAFDQAVDVTLRRKLDVAQEAVRSALAKLGNGTYGLCETCGTRIDRARLEALPHARHCLDCQARLEHSGKGAR